MISKENMIKLQQAPLNCYVVISNFAGEIHVELTDDLTNYIEENYLTQLNLQQVDRSYVLQRNEAVTIPLKWARMWKDFLENQASHFNGRYHYVKA